MTNGFTPVFPLPEEPALGLVVGGSLSQGVEVRLDTDGRTSVEDLKAACEILFESIVLKVDELDGSLRQFFEQLKAYVRSKGEEYEFNRFEVRKACGLSKTQQHFYISKLVELEYLRQFGFANRGYRYKIAHWDDVAAMRRRIKGELNNQLQALKV